VTFSDPRIEKFPVFFPVSREFSQRRVSARLRAPPRSLKCREISLALRRNMRIVPVFRELLKLGFTVSEPTVSRWLQRVPRSPDVGKRWLTFLRNHRDAIAAMDFFTVPTLTFGVLYCFFVISHDRRKILRCNVTRNPSALWVVQQMREAWPYVPAHRFLLFDRD
jgi:hypothetical protein